MILSDLALQLLANWLEKKWDLCLMVIVKSRLFLCILRVITLICVEVDMWIVLEKLVHLNSLRRLEHIGEAMRIIHKCSEYTV